MLYQTTVIPETCDLMHTFKEHCSSKNWKVYNNGDVVEVDHEYHKFFWIRIPSIVTVKNIVLHAICPLCEDDSYRLITPTYMAWVLPEAFSEKAWSCLLHTTPELFKTIAFYDLGRVYSDGESQGVKLDETNSIVFHEFERFLKKKYGVVFTPLPQSQPRDRRINTTPSIHSTIMNRR